MTTDALNKMGSAVLLPSEHCATTEECSLIGKRANDIHGGHFPYLPIFIKERCQYVFLILNIYQPRSVENGPLVHTYKSILL